MKIEDIDLFRVDIKDLSGKMFARIHVGAETTREAEAIGLAWSRNTHPNVKVKEADAKRVRVNGSLVSLYVQSARLGRES